MRCLIVQGKGEKEAGQSGQFMFEIERIMEQAEIQL